MLLCVGLLLTPSLISAQSSPQTSKLGPNDYQSFLTDSLTVRLQLVVSRKALETALVEKQIIEQNLADAQQRYDDLAASATQRSEDSTRLYGQALAELRLLRQQLKESRALVTALRESLESAQAEYAGKLRDVAKKLRRQRAGRWLLALLVGATSGYVGYKVGSR